MRDHGEVSWWRAAGREGRGTIPSPKEEEKGVRAANRSICVAASLLRSIKIGKLGARTWWTAGRGWLWRLRNIFLLGVGGSR